MTEEKVTDISTRRPAPRKPPQFIYRCKCGSELFYLQFEGHVECLECGAIHEHIVWAQPGAIK